MSFLEVFKGVQAAACTTRQISASDDGQFVTDATLKPESKKQAAAAAAAAASQATTDASAKPPNLHTKPNQCQVVWEIGDGDTTVNRCLRFPTTKSYLSVSAMFGNKHRKREGGMGSGTVDKFIYRPVDKQTGSSRASDPRKSSAVFLNERFQICSSTRSLLASCLRNAHTESSALCPATSPPPPENAGARASRGVDTPPCRCCRRQPHFVPIMQQVLLCWNTPQHTDNEQGRPSQDDEDDEDDDEGGRRWFGDKGGGRDETTASSRGAEAVLSSPALLPSLGSAVSQGWRRQSEALAREAGSYASMGRRKSANAFASVEDQSYFSVSTS